MFLGCNSNFFVLNYIVSGTIMAAVPDYRRSGAIPHLAVSLESLSLAERCGHQMAPVLTVLVETIDVSFAVFRPKTEISFSPSGY